MSITSKQYAILTEDSYIQRPVGIRPPQMREPIYAGGIKFEVIEHRENRLNGYAGSIYQRVDTGELTTAHSPR